MLPTHLTINANYNGPPQSGNGGYSCGVLGQYIDGPAEVMLRVPPPLNKPLQINKQEAGKLLLLDGETIVAEGKPKSFEMALPAPIAYEAAVASSSNYIGYSGHHFDTCFVCGPNRQEGDGLRIFAGTTGQADVVAAPWKPFDALFDEARSTSRSILLVSYGLPELFCNCWQADVCVVTRQNGLPHCKPHNTP